MYTLSHEVMIVCVILMQKRQQIEIGKATMSCSPAPLSDARSPHMHGWSGRLGPVRQVCIQICLCHIMSPHEPIRRTLRSCRLNRTAHCVHDRHTAGRKRRICMDGPGPDNPDSCRRAQQKLQTFNVNARTDLRNNVFFWFCRS